LEVRKRMLSKVLGKSDTVFKNVIYAIISEYVRAQVKLSLNLSSAVIMLYSGLEKKKEMTHIVQLTIVAYL
jgi:hypothetical protein